MYTCVRVSVLHSMSSLIIKFAGSRSCLLARMTWTRLVAWPQMSGPNMIEYGVSPPIDFMSDVDGKSLM